MGAANPVRAIGSGDDRTETAVSQLMQFSTNAKITSMKLSHPVPPNVRLQQLLRVPDRERTEDQWDELIELEIMLAPEDRESTPQN